MRDLLLVGAGGFVGANARYLVSTFVAQRVSASLPWGTFVVNVVGSFVLSAFVVWTADRVVADPTYRLLVAVGFCGAFTTFSSFSVETLKLLEGGHLWTAAGNILANNLAALAAAIAGAALARWY